MISDVRGAILPHPPWGAFTLDRVLQYYDGPRLLLQRSQSNQLFLAWWNDSDESTERWIYLPVSEHRLQEILSGEIPSLDGLNAPEDGYLFVVDRDLHRDSITKTVMTDASALLSDTLPRQGAKLSIPVPKDVVDLATRERVHVVNVKMESKSSDPTGRISATIAGQFMGNLQRFVDAVGQANTGRPTSRGVIPDSILNETRLDPISTYAGSFGIRFETNKQDDLFGESLVKESLERLFDLLDVGYQASELTDHLTELKARVAKNYKDLLSTIETSLSTVSLSWIQPGTLDLRHISMNDETARNIIAQIESFSDLTKDNLTLEGRFVGGNVRTLRFEIETSDTDERLDGSIHEDAISEVEHTRLNSSCRVVLDPTLQVNEVTGEERTIYTLLSIEQI